MPMAIMLLSTGLNAKNVAAGGGAMNVCRVCIGSNKYMQLCTKRGLKKKEKKSSSIRECQKVEEEILTIYSGQHKLWLSTR
jgi:acyl CoA:acetate/3-ketoacid CoA transferase beta subunit